MAVDTLHFGFVNIVEVQTADGGMEAFAACFFPTDRLLWELGDAGLVGVGADIAVGHTARHPYSAFLPMGFTGDFEEPYFVGVGKGEGLAPIGITVFGHEIGHHTDGFAAVAGTLKGEIDEIAVVDAYSVAFGEGFDASPGGFAHGELVFVDEAYDAIGERSLRYVYLVFQATVVVKAEHLARRMGAAWMVAQLSVSGVAVGGIGNHRATVGGTAFR